MPLPPATVQIKRKRTDESPDLLHVQNDFNGLHGSKDYAYKRHRISAAAQNNYGLNPAAATTPPSEQAAPAISDPNRPPVIQPTKAGDETQGQYLRGFTRRAAPPNTGVFNYAGPGTNGLGPSAANPVRNTTAAQRATSEVRRFHLARSAIPSSPQSASSSTKRTKGNTLFVERRRPAAAKKVLRDGVTRDKSLPNVTHRSQGENKTAPTPALQPRTPPPLRNVRQPSGKVLPWDADQAEMDAAMQAYTLSEITKNIAEAEATSKEKLPIPFVPRSVSSRFKPKTPVKRYHERHPEDAMTVDKIEVQQSEKDEVMADDGDSAEDDSDYIIDTFVRVPVEMLDMQAPTQKIGLLVLDSQPDIDEFYNDDSDDDSEIYDEEEDENAENHPSTDYPDDEVDSDDEFGRNPYLYRKRNASDDEEFDEDDATFSDDDDIVGTTKPWSRQPPWMRTMIEKKVHDDEE